MREASDLIHELYELTRKTAQIRLRQNQSRIQSVANRLSELDKQGMPLLDLPEVFEESGEHQSLVATRT